MSIDITEVIESIKRLVPTIDGPTLTAIETDLEAKQAELAADKDPTPKAKTEHALVIIDPEGKLADLGDFVGFAAQVPEGTDLSSIPTRIAKASYAQNAGGKRKRWNIQSYGEIGDLKPKYLREQDVKIKTGKQPVRVLIVPNLIPAA